MPGLISVWSHFSIPAEESDNEYTLALFPSLDCVQSEELGGVVLNNARQGSRRPDRLSLSGNFDLGESLDDMVESGYSVGLILNRQVVPAAGPDGD